MVRDSPESGRVEQAPTAMCKEVQQFALALPGSPFGLCSWTATSQLPGVAVSLQVLGEISQ